MQEGSATGGAADAGGPLPHASVDPLRSEILNLVCTGASGGRARENAGLCEYRDRFQEFLETDDVGRGLSIWFGDLLAGLSGDRLRAAVDRDVAEIDDRISEIVETVMAEERFLRLRGVWAGVRWLVAPNATGRSARTVSVRVLNVSLKEFNRDLTKSPEFDQTQLFAKIHDQEFGIAGGTPFGLMIADYELQHTPLPAAVDPIALLRETSRIAAAAFCPVVFSSTPALFGVDRFGELARRENIRATFEQVEYQRLKSFQETANARFIAMTVGRLICRTPLRGRATGDCGYVHRPRRREGAGSEVWIGAGFGVAHAAIRAFSQFSWPAAIRGAPERDGRADIAGGVIEPIVAAHFATDRPGIAAKVGVEASLSDRQEAEINQLGFIALRHAPYTEYSAVYNVPTMLRPRSSKNPETDYSMRMGAMLNYVLCVCRFAHYVKIIVRDWVGSYRSAADCERALTKWIDGYCIASDDAAYRERARFPLRRAKITVSEKAGEPGVFSCVMQFQPHFQLDYIVSDFQLTTSISTTAEAA